MAVRTISAAGGNWNSTATWVEGAVPTSSDHVVGNGSSGQLTMNVAGTIQYIDLQNYTNTLTMTNNITLGLAAATSIIGSGMTFSGIGEIIIGNIAHSLTQFGSVRIPFLRLGSNNKTMNTNIYTNRLRCSNANSTMNGNKIYVDTALSRVSVTDRFNGTTEIVCDGNTLIETPIFSTTNPGTLTIDAPSFTATSQTSGSFAITPGQTFNLLNGFLSITSSSQKIILIQSTAFATSNIKITTGQVLDFLITRSVNFIDTSTIGKLNITSTITDLDITTNTGLTMSNLNIYTDNTFLSSIRLSTGHTFTTDNMQIFAASQLTNDSIKFLTLKSLNSGTQVNLNITDGSKSMNYNANFTDINATGNTIRVLTPTTISNCTNVVSTNESNFYSSGGGGQTAYTFFS